MYVWFYVLNHSKYRFPFHAVCIGIMNGIRKPAFHDARYNQLKCLASNVRSGPPQSVRRAFFHLQTVVILHREPTRPQDSSRRASETFGSNSPARIFPIARWERGVPLSDKLCFVRPRYSLCEAVVFSRVERLQCALFKRHDHIANRCSGAAGPRVESPKY